MARVPVGKWERNTHFWERVDTAEAAVKAVVTGLVQGVGYRFYAVGQARRLGLAGYVKNLPDGNVEALAEGERGILQEFIKLLRVGPVGADVAGVQVDWLPPSGNFKTFSIVY